MNDYHEVTMRFMPETVKKVTFLFHRWKCLNRVDAVSRCIKLAHSIVSEMDAGGSVVLYRHTGERRELKFDDSDIG